MLVAVLVLWLVVTCRLLEVAAAPPPLAPCPEGCRCDLAGSPRRVDCSRLGLAEFPATLHFSTQYLDVSFNKLTSLPEHLNLLVPQLETLIMNHNKLENMAGNEFRDMVELRTLDLSDNSLNGSLPSRLVTTNPRISVLLLARNRGLSSPGHLQSSVLETLDLSGCNVTRLNATSFLALPALRSLNMSHNPITYLPENMTVPNLRVLDFTHCTLASVPPYVLTGMPKLEHLHVSSNPRLDLPSKPPLISKSLLKLTADHCGIQQVQISNLKALTHAYLSCNKISVINRSNFARNSALLEIDLRQNLLRELPVDVFMNAKHLVSVDLSSNHIESLQYDSFSCCKELKFLNLSRNDITQLPNILTMPTVEVLDLSRCRLESLPDNSDFLDNMAGLHQLYLHHNELQVMPKLVSNSLRILDLSYCHLTQITNETFSHLSELKRLSLVGNRLTSLNADIFEANKKMGFLYLEDNPWRCNCSDPEFKSLYELADQLSETGHNQLTCKDPEELSGKSWEVACQDNGPDISESTKWLLSLTLFMTLVALCGVVMCTKGLFGAGRKPTTTREARRLAREEQRRAGISQVDSSSDDETPHVHVSRAESSQCRTCSSGVRTQRRVVESQPPTYEEAVLMPPRSNSITTASTTNIPISSEVDADVSPDIETTEDNVSPQINETPVAVEDESSGASSDQEAEIASVSSKSGSDGSDKHNFEYVTTAETVEPEQTETDF
ncbi:hypothetical protein B566_EDAN006061 [Ephemera danica]|nr:hypothetical protein B566_EDAN006061 [Ephemera danica]